LTASSSYYETVGKRHARPNRGMLTRPALSDILDYRKYVDAAMTKFTAQQPDAKWQTLLELGIHHEQQHQELLLTDILHLFAQNPIKPEYRKPAPALARTSAPAPLSWKTYQGGIAEAGYNGGGFHFDCEGPRHKVYLNPYALATRLVTVREYIEFMKDGGYNNPALWLSDGWATVKKEGWDAPLYWEEQDGQWWNMTLQGFRPVEMDAPVTNVSFYEAQAYAAWAGCRLPTEFEWESAASMEPAADFTNSKLFRPAPAPEQQAPGTLAQMYGDVWQWTSSAFMPYPGFKPAEGAVGEYNGKFMGSQYVLRGGSCATPTNHTRSTYRNFFYPHQRWQFTGLRLAKDAS
jgi:ergothioneine biosynthesis protein EgtB